MEILRPRADFEDGVGPSGHVFYGNVCVLLGRVGAQFAVQDGLGGQAVAAAQHHVAVLDRFAAQGQAGMGLSERAVFHQDAAVGTVLRGLVGKGSLAALEDYAVVANVHVTVFYEHVMAVVQVDRVGAVPGDAFRRGGDGEPQETEVVAPVRVGGPIGTVFQVEVLKRNVAAFREIDQSGPLSVLVGGGLVPFPSDLHFLPERKAASVHGPGSAQDKTVHPFDVDEGREVRTGLPFDAGCRQREIMDAVRCFQPTLHPKVGALPEVQGAAAESPFRDQYHASLFGCQVNDVLDGLGLDPGGIPDHTVVGQDKDLSQGGQRYPGRVVEPCRHGGPVREPVFPGIEGDWCQKNQDEEKDGGW